MKIISATTEMYREQNFSRRLFMVGGIDRSDNDSP